jgi:hypothetical protein
LSALLLLQKRTHVNDTDFILFNVKRVMKRITDDYKKADDLANKLYNDSTYETPPSPRIAPPPSGFEADMEDAGLATSTARMFAPSTTKVCFLCEP